MAITMMVGEDRRGEEGTFELNDFRGAEKGLVSHDRQCPHYGKHDVSGALQDDCVREKFARCYIHKGLVMATTHVGLVLSTGEYNGRDDSDFFARIWNEEKGCPEPITYASTRGWTYPNHAEVDATPEVRAKAEAWDAERAAERAAEKAAREAATPRVGKVLKVVRGRKVPLGTEGECFWIGEDKYRRGAFRVGLRDAKGAAHWTSAGNVEVVPAT